MSTRFSCLTALPRPLRTVLRLLAVGTGLLGAAREPLLAASSDAEAEQLRIIGAMTEQMRDRIDTLPVLIPAGFSLAETKEITVTLNKDPVVVEGQRFDGVVITTPAEKAAFAWAFASPANASRWYIFREAGDMRGFRNFVRQPRANFPLASAWKPEGVAMLTFQGLDAASLEPNTRYVLWFGFKDEQPAEFSIRAGFFKGPTLNNNRLPALLFPAPTP